MGPSPTDHVFYLVCTPQDLLPIAFARRLVTSETSFIRSATFLLALNHDGSGYRWRLCLRSLAKSCKPRVNPFSTRSHSGLPSALGASSFLTPCLGIKVSLYLHLNLKLVDGDNSSCSFLREMAVRRCCRPGLYISPSLKHFFMSFLSSEYRSPPKSSKLVFRLRSS